MSCFFTQEDTSLSNAFMPRESEQGLLFQYPEGWLKCTKKHWERVYTELCPQIEGLFVAGVLDSVSRASILKNLTVSLGKQHFDDVQTRPSMSGLYDSCFGSETSANEGETHSSEPSSITLGKKPGDLACHINLPMGLMYRNTVKSKDLVLQYTIFHSYQESAWWAAKSSQPP